jgi:two-component system chemotaxis sensor kinase CheA
MDDNSKYRELFFEETDEHLQNLNDQVMELENDPEKVSILDEIFRSAHTLKGMAATMGYTTMAELTHKMENVFELLKTGKLTADEGIVTLIFDCLDMLSAIVEDLRAGNEGEQDTATLKNKLDNLLASTKAAPKDETVSEANLNETTIDDSNFALGKLDSSDISVIRDAHEKSYNAFFIKVSLDETSMMKNARVYVVINKLEKSGDILYSDPDVVTMENEDFGNEFTIVYLTKTEKTAVEEQILETSEIEGVFIHEITAEDLNAETAVVEATIHPEADEHNAETEIKATITAKPKQAANHSNSMNQSIRVDIEKLDSFMNLMSELVIYRTRLEEINEDLQRSELREPLEQVSRIATDLQELVLKIRMQPLSVVTNRFGRMIRDLSNELEKDIDLVIEGDDTELDKTVVSELGEPLIHLLRNAVDHGVETPEDRTSKGKNPKGTIRITAYQEGNRVFLTVSDDGKGVNPSVIKESAARKGIETEHLSDKEIQQLIFHPGFSTAKNVTNISGRGVGMDVVKQKINELGGTIEIISEVDKGTSFRMSLPLTLSIIQALLVTVGTEQFALPLGVVRKVIRPEPEEIVQTHTGEVYYFEDETIPVVRLQDSLDIHTGMEEKPYLIIVKIDERLHALAVDNLIRQQEIVIKELGKELKNINKYLGATIMGNGNIILILDITAICNERNVAVYA